MKRGNFKAAGSTVSHSEQKFLWAGHRTNQKNELLSQNGLRQCLLWKLGKLSSCVNEWCNEGKKSRHVITF